MEEEQKKLSRSFIWRRIHSLFGLWIVIFLIEHLVTNSQAALLVGDNGMGFVRAVNFLKNLPFLPVIEIVLLGVPILYHAIWGITYAIRSRINSYPSRGATPSLNKYSRNHAYAWQRYTSWILLIGIALHVMYMRFYRYPVTVNQGDQSYYFVRLGMDNGLYTVADRLGVKLYDQKAINVQKDKLRSLGSEYNKLKEEAQQIRGEDEEDVSYHPSEAQILEKYQNLVDRREWVKALSSRKLSEDQVMAESNEFGIATLLVVRDSFRSPFKGILYTIFVLAATFHGFNGLWTFLITWGVVMRVRSQKNAVKACYGFMFLITFLGLAAIWGTYYINLRH